MRPIVLQEVRPFPVHVQPSAAQAWAQPSGFGRMGAAHAYFGGQPKGPRRVKHPPVRFDKGMAVDQLA